MLLAVTLRPRSPRDLSLTPAQQSLATRQGDASEKTVPEFLNRTEELAELRKVLADQVTVVVFVTGQPGVGKTRLAHEVHDEFNRDLPYWHDTRPLQQIDVMTLVEDIEFKAGVPDPGAPLGAEETLLGRLEAGVAALQLARPTLRPTARAHPVTPCGNAARGSATSEPSGVP